MRGKKPQFSTKRENSSTSDKGASDTAWLYPRINAKLSGRELVDLDVFINIIFPRSPVKRKIAKAIIEDLIEKGRVYLKDLQKTRQFNAQTLSDTWKALYRGGIIERHYRYEPMRLSLRFSRFLQALADYWESYVKTLGGKKI